MVAKIIIFTHTAINIKAIKANFLEWILTTSGLLSLLLFDSPSIEKYINGIDIMEPTISITNKPVGIGSGEIGNIPPRSRAYTDKYEAAQIIEIKYAHFSFRITK